MRTTILMLCTSLACSITPDSSNSLSGGGGDGSTPGADEGNDESSAGDPGSESTTDVGDEGDSDGTFDPNDSSGEAGESGSEAGSEGAAESSEVGGDPPTDDDAYQPCTGNEQCTSDPGLACLKADENGAEGFCSPACGTYGASPPDPQLCPPAPEGVAATVVCLEGLIRNCALSCADDGECPAGSACLPANGGSGPFCFGV